MQRTRPVIRKLITDRVTGGRIPVTVTVLAIICNATRYTRTIFEMVLPCCGVKLPFESMVAIVRIRQLRSKRTWVAAQGMEPNKIGYT